MQITQLSIQDSLVGKPVNAQPQALDHLCPNVKDSLIYFYLENRDNSKKFNPFDFNQLSCIKEETSEINKKQTGNDESNKLSGIHDAFQ